MELRIVNGARVRPDRRLKDTLIAFNSDRITGYTPLIKLYHVLTRKVLYENSFEIPMFTNYALKNEFVFNNADSFYVFQPRMTSYNDKARLSLNISMLSIFGLQQFRRRTTGSLCSSTVEYMMTNIVDVFSLCLVKTSKVSNITTYRNRDMVINSEDLLVLISEEKLKNPIFMKQWYNTTSRNYLWKDYRTFMEINGIEWKVVKDSEIARYYHNPYSLKTSSIMEIIEIDKAVKEEVFVNNKKEIKYD